MKKFVLSMLLVVSSVFAYEDAETFIENYKPYDQAPFGDILDKNGLVVGTASCIAGKYSLYFNTYNPVTDNREGVRKEMPKYHFNYICEAELMHPDYEDPEPTFNKDKKNNSRNCLYVYEHIPTSPDVNGVKNTKTSVYCPNKHHPLTEEPFEWADVITKENFYSELDRLEEWNNKHGHYGFLWKRDDNDGLTQEAEVLQKAIDGAHTSGYIVDDNGNMFANVYSDRIYTDVVVETTKGAPKYRFFKNTDIYYSTDAERYYNNYKRYYKVRYEYECMPSNSAYSTSGELMGFMVKYARHIESGEDYRIHAYPVLNSKYEYRCEPKWEHMELSTEELSLMIELGISKLRPIYYVK